MPNSNGSPAARLILLCVNKLGNMPPASLLGPFVDVDNAQAAPIVGNAPTALTFTMQSQQQDNWCWAAITSSICAFYPPPNGTRPKEQCEIATTFLGVPCCLNPLPAPSADWPGNKTFSLEVPLNQFGHLAKPKIPGFLEFPSIVQEIDGQRPVCCHIDWGGESDGHFVVIVGYDSANQEVFVRDPSRSPVHGNLPYKGSATFPGGKWNETYLTS